MATGYGPTCALTHTQSHSDSSGALCVLLDKWGCGRASSPWSEAVHCLWSGLLKDMAAEELLQCLSKRPSCSSRKDRGRSPPPHL